MFEYFWESHLEGAPPPFVGPLSHKLFRRLLTKNIKENVLKSLDSFSKLLNNISESLTKHFKNIYINSKLS